MRKMSNIIDKSWKKDENAYSGIDSKWLLNFLFNYVVVLNSLVRRRPVINMVSCTQGILRVTFIAVGHIKKSANYSETYKTNLPNTGTGKE